MKISVASAGYDINSLVSDIFGRSSFFIVSDTENGQIKEISPIENYIKNNSGSGSTAAQLLVDKGITVLISGKMGPVAFQILKNACIKVYKITPGSVGKNLKRFNESKLEEVTSLSPGFPL